MASDEEIEVFRPRALLALHELGVSADGSYFAMVDEHGHRAVFTEAEVKAGTASRQVVVRSNLVLEVVIRHLGKNAYMRSGQMDTQRVAEEPGE